MTEFENVFLVDEDGTDVTAFEPLQPTVLTTKAQVSEVMETADRAVWIAPRKEGLWSIMGAIALHQIPRRHSLLALEVLSPKSLMAIPTMFRCAVCSPPARLLARRELAEVMAWEGRSDMCIGGTVDERSGVVTLYRGDLEAVSLPLAFFEEAEPGIAGDTGRFDVVHHGQMLRFGDHHISFEDVLFECDPDFRRAKKSQQIHQDETFGGSVRRLRMAMGLKRSDFPGIAERTIARIERGEVQKPHGRTLYILAKIFGIPPEEIEQH